MRDVILGALWVAAVLSIDSGHGLHGPIGPALGTVQGISVDLGIPMVWPDVRVWLAEGV